MKIEWTAEFPEEMAHSPYYGLDQAGNRYFMPKERDYCNVSMRDGRWGCGSSAEEALKNAMKEVCTRHFQMSVRDKTRGRTYTQEVSSAWGLKEKEPLRQFLKEEAHSFVRRIGRGKNIWDFEVKVRPLESKELQPAREMGKEGMSR